MFSIDGLVSGLDTTKIIDGLLSIQQRQVDLLNARKQDVTQEQNAFKGIEAKLLGLRGSLARLVRSQNSVFSDRQANVSHAGLVSAVADSSAAEGVYQLHITSLARAHQIASQGFVSADSAITEGSLDIRVGDGTTTNITVDQTNNTLQGLVDAINVADLGVSASIVKDGTGPAPYRIVITSGATGTDHAITVVNNLAAPVGDVDRPGFSGPAVQAAEDASVTLGSGPGAITVTSTTNQVDGLIGGVTLKLLDAEPETEVSVTISRDTASARAAVTEFVRSYNDVMAFIDNQVRFDAQTEAASPLLGNHDAISIQDGVRALVNGLVTGVNSKMNRLSALGIQVSDAGQLVVDSARLDDALSGGLSGVTGADLNRLFALDGQSDHGGVQFLAGSDRTLEGSLQVVVTQAAERASVLAGTALAESIVIDGTNDEFSITLDGKTTDTLALTAGTYTRQEFADHVQAVINDTANASGRAVSVSLQNNALKITSDQYGAASEVTIGSGTALTSLGFLGGETDAGVDVAGKFLVDGIEETAHGSGRLLTGDSANVHTADVQLRVTLAPGQVQPGTAATVKVTRGLASRLDQWLAKTLDSTRGTIQTVDDGFDRRIEDIEQSVTRFNDMMEARRQSLVTQFTALEAALSQLQSTSSFLSAQLTGMSSLTANSKK
jgi:flagellar hook-associated protein 2